MLRGLLFSPASMLLPNDLQRHTQLLLPELQTAVSRVLSRGWFVLGPELQAFEQEFAAWCGTKRCVGTANGTDALELALRAIGVSDGSQVATVANAGMYATTAILASGARPVYVDIDPGTFNMDPQQLQACASRVDAIVVTHLYGRMAPMPQVLAAAGRTPVIEDCAQAHGAMLHGRRAGTWGTAGCFSFYPTKNLGACGDGGAIVTADDALAERLEALRQYGWTRRYQASIPGGRNSRLDELQAAVLRVKLLRVDDWNERRREIARHIGVPREGAGDVVHLLVVRHHDRDRLREWLRDRDIGADVHYPIPDYRQPAVVARVGATEPLKHTERACSEVLTLPCFPEMTDAEALHVREALRSFR